MEVVVKECNRTSHCRCEILVETRVSKKKCVARFNPGYCKMTTHLHGDNLRAVRAGQ